MSKIEIVNWALNHLNWGGKNISWVGLKNKLINQWLEIIKHCII